MAKLSSLTLELCTVRHISFFPFQIFYQVSLFYLGSDMCGNLKYLFFVKKSTFLFFHFNIYVNQLHGSRCFFIIFDALLF